MSAVFRVLFRIYSLNNTVFTAQFKVYGVNCLNHSVLTTVQCIVGLFTRY